MFFLNIYYRNLSVYSPPVHLSASCNKHFYSSYYIIDSRGVPVIIGIIYTLLISITWLISILPKYTMDLFVTRLVNV